MMKNLIALCVVSTLVFGCERTPTPEDLNNLRDTVTNGVATTTALVESAKTTFQEASEALKQPGGCAKVQGMVKSITQSGEAAIAAGALVQTACAILPLFKQDDKTIRTLMNDVCPTVTKITDAVPAIREQAITLGAQADKLCSMLKVEPCPVPVTPAK
jgi:hypothetical protein